MPTGVSLQVKDGSGRTVEETTGGLGLAGRAQLPTLYQLVYEQDQRSRQAIARLANEFRSPG